jgi:hypothetical protein
MTPKEKAKELIEMFIFFASNEGTTEDGFIYSDEMQMFNAKQCALIAVDEILNSFGLTANGQTFFTEYRAVQFWNEVKQEIETFNTNEK